MDTQTDRDIYYLIMRQNRLLERGMKSTKRWLIATMILSTLFILLATWDLLK